MGPGNKGARRSKPWRSRPWDLELGGLDHRGLDRHYATCRDRVALWALGIRKVSLFLDGREKRLERNRPPQNGGIGGSVDGLSWWGPDDQPKIWAKLPSEWAGAEVLSLRGENWGGPCWLASRMGQTAPKWAALLQKWLCYLIYWMSQFFAVANFLEISWQLSSPTSNIWIYEY